MKQIKISIIGALVGLLSVIAMVYLFRFNSLIGAWIGISNTDESRNLFLFAVLATLAEMIGALARWAFIDEIHCNPQQN